MAYTVKLTAPAESDAYKAFEHIREEAPQRAEQWLIELFQTIDTLDEIPRRCAVIAETQDIGREVRHRFVELICAGRSMVSSSAIVAQQVPLNDEY
jgi:plasmid stabilization system protein ParE